MTFTVDFGALTTLSDQQFYELCRAHPDVKFERTPGGYLLLMPPTGGETGNRNIEIGADFVIWNRQSKLGVLFDSSTCFRLPGGGDRSPDIAWVKQERWEALSPADRERFPPIAPDFVLELMSPSDTLRETQAKMEEYMGSGVRLGWLINRKQRRVWIYRPEIDSQLLENPVTLSGEATLPGFSLDMAAVW
ncbi:Uma2 family endonuclease [Leptolyngbya cf. ectocarpi LEGE 11479]|uniref:Uma2 family endonuclease n=1 Tax=Leptolyngbya cf. ectocarpi LEGE 11479 TaxID=1828722 RepID=A0A928ZYT8_LEPEC|nr:Uma2 family endonuclease [Leptolyngbya ectocarpi]MBE9070009.1 Uma2 family endonuclease [Leptolyngbya cf. ectocarpi LEGE 11479]